MLTNEAFYEIMNALGKDVESLDMPDMTEDSKLKEILNGLAGAGIGGGAEEIYLGAPEDADSNIKLVIDTTAESEETINVPAVYVYHQEDVDNLRSSFDESLKLIDRLNNHDLVFFDGYYDTENSIWMNHPFLVTEWEVEWDRVYIYLHDTRVLFYTEVG